MGKIDNFAVPIPSGLTAVPNAGALSAIRRAALLENLRQFQQARARALAGARSYVVGAAKPAESSSPVEATDEQA